MRRGAAPREYHKTRSVACRRCTEINVPIILCKIVRLKSWNNKKKCSVCGYGSGVQGLYSILQKYDILGKFFFSPVACCGARRFRGGVVEEVHGIIYSDKH